MGLMEYSQKTAWICRESKYSALPTLMKVPRIQVTIHINIKVLNLYMLVGAEM